MIPPAIVIAPIESPNPGDGGTGTRSYSGRFAPTATPARAQNTSESYDPLSASGPRSPCPVRGRR